MLPELEQIGLQGVLELRIATAADYRRLARFHYNRALPATFALTVTVDHVTSPYTRYPVAAAVLSNPTLNCKVREQAMQLGRVPQCWKWEYLNRHLRTVSRVVVHPQFRGIGISGELVKFLLRQAPTRYVEAISQLASHHPLFERAGMKCIVKGDDERAAYYLYDVQEQTLRSRKG